jgi:hypothetical protein
VRHRVHIMSWSAAAPRESALELRVTSLIGLSKTTPLKVETSASLGPHGQVIWLRLSLSSEKNESDEVSEIHQ